jgi:soluble lytic murein transglycosylase-like protein
MGGFFIILGLAGLPVRIDAADWNRFSENSLYSIIARTAKRYQIEIELIKAMIMAESGYDVRAVSHRGACGLMQLMPETAASLGVVDCFDPEQNIDAGVRYFHKLKTLFNKNVTLALAAYNTGPTRVK